ncbi:hypothetical protein AB6D20_023855 [Vibrio splendidus]
MEYYNTKRIKVKLKA